MDSAQMIERFFCNSCRSAALVLALSAVMPGIASADVVFAPENCPEQTRFDVEPQVRTRQMGSFTMLIAEDIQPGIAYRTICITGPEQTPTEEIARQVVGITAGSKVLSFDIKQQDADRIVAEARVGTEQDGVAAEAIYEQVITKGSIILRGAVYTPATDENRRRTRAFIARQAPRP
jgi:hypothetical protein